MQSIGGKKRMSGDGKAVKLTREARLVLSILFLTFAVVLLLLVLSPGASAEEPIVIEGDQHFHAKAELENWPGQGTAESPYVIENFFIYSQVTNGIDIRNTGVYFIIRYGEIWGDEQQFSGIRLQSVENGTIYGNDLFYNNIGIEVMNSGLLTLESNIVDSNNRGITLTNSEDMTIAKNNVNYSTERGIDGAEHGQDHVELVQGCALDEQDEDDGDETDDEGLPLDVA